VRGERVKAGLASRRQPAPVELPVLPAYGGCKSWLELAEDIPDAKAVPVLTDEAFQARLCAVEAAGGGALTPV
jgi:hypothetical protein